jgi:hypothetical protein
MSKLLSFSLLACGWLIVLSLTPACRRDQEHQAARAQPVDEPAKQVVQLLFPDSVRVEDPSVNEFVTRVMRDCAGGDYDAFRLLWSARAEPLPRDEYEEGWQAIQRIKIRALERVLLAQGSDDEAETDAAYALAMDVALDPAHRAGQRAQHREVVLLLVHEHGAWRLAHAPRAVRTWVKSLTDRPEAAGPLPASRPDGHNEPD